MKTSILSLITPLALSVSAWAQGPTVVGTQPVRHALSAPAAGPVTVTFDQPVTGPAAGAVRVFGNQRRGLRPGSASAAGSQVSFQPAQPFAPGEQVQVTVPAAVASPARVYEFTAAAAPALGSFTAADHQTPGTVTSLAAGDIDNDGDLDLVSLVNLNAGASFFTHINNGHGQFTSQNVSLGTGISYSFYSKIQLADFNNDGNLDLFMVGESLYIRNGTGTGNFTGGTSIAAAYSRDAKAADLNGDGYLDLAVLAPYAPNGLIIGWRLSVWLNNQAGGFTSVLSHEVPANLLLAIADIDEDGDMDLLGSVCQSCTDKVGVLLNDGNAQFTSGTAVALNMAADKLITGDFNGDGHIDVAATSSNVAAVHLLLGSGSGSLQAPLALPAFSRVTHLSSGDLDGDGDLDLLITNDRGITQFARNNGSGWFSVTANLIAWRFFEIAQVADLNGDGTLDVYIEGSAGPAGFDLFFNQLAPLASHPAPPELPLELYPNPAHDRLTLHLLPTTGPVAVEVFNTLGQCVLALPPARPGSDNSLPVPLTGLAAGVYTLRVQTGSSVASRRLVVQ